MRQGLAFSTISSNNNSKKPTQKKKTKIIYFHRCCLLLFGSTVFSPSLSPDHSHAIVNFSLTSRVILPCFSGFLYIFIFNAPFALQRHSQPYMKYFRIYDFGYERCLALPHRHQYCWYNVLSNGTIYVTAKATAPATTNDRQRQRISLRKWDIRRARV